MFQRPGIFTGLIYLVIGLIFAYNSARMSGSETHWGWALTGLTCIILSGKFMGLDLGRSNLPGKSGRPGPLE